MVDNLAIDLSISATLVDFQKLIAERTGLYFSERKWNMLNSAIGEFCKEQNITNMSVAYRLLNSHVTESGIWRKLISGLTINETFFFRHFAGIENKLLPQIIHENKSIKQLRIWSAGCSTGEEPYSIAMTLKKLIPDIENWNIHILATDIDLQVLNTGRKGVYREWSMRQIKPFYLKNYFNIKNSEYILDPAIRKLVHFEYLNLKEGLFPSAANGTTDLDLIFCRNVTIYFEAQETIKIAGRFFEALKKGGKLVVGHSEPSTFIYDQYRSEIFDDIVIYNKDLTHLPKSKPIKNRIQPPEDRRMRRRRIENNEKTFESSKTAAKRTVTKEERLVERRKNPNLFDMRFHAVELLEQNRLEESAKILDKLLILNQKSADLFFISGYVRAKMGDFENADLYCTKSIGIDNTFQDAWLLRSIIAREQWKLDEAKKYSRHLILKNLTYLPAYLELFQIAHMEDDKMEQKRLAKKITTIAAKLNPKEKYDILEGMTVEQIKNLVNVMIQE